MKTEKYNKPFVKDGITFYPLPTIRHKYLEKMTLVFMASLHQLSIPNLDVVHFQAVGPSIFAFIPRMFGRYTVFQSHGHEWQRDSWNRLAKLFFHTAESLTFRMVNNASAVSKNLKAYYEGKYKKTVTYIPSGITPSAKQSIAQIARFNVQENGYFLYVGRLSKEKKIEDLIKAYQRLDGCSKKLVIVGKERPEDKEYVTFLKGLSNSNSDILFVGPAYGSELVEWYSNCYAYILPSSIEGLPITLLEAMSFSRCCIASDIEANKEALDDKGFHYKLGDIEQLSSILQETLTNPELVSSTGYQLMDHVNKHFTWQQITEDFINFYNHRLLPQK